MSFKIKRRKHTYGEVKRAASGIILILLLTIIFTSPSDIQPVTAESGTIIVPDDYPTIQAAVNAASPGETIIVRDGTYFENVDVNKSLNIKSENGAEVTIVRAANSYDHVFEVNSVFVNISGFTVRGASHRMGGIYLASGAGHCIISNNKAFYNSRGIYLYFSNYNTIKNNNVSYNPFGIYLYSSSENTINNNDALHCSSGSWGVGIMLHYYSNSNVITNNNALNNYDCGIHLAHHSSSNVIKNNNASNNEGDGIWLYYSGDSTIINNTVLNNRYGVFLWNSNNNMLNNNDVSKNYHGIRVWYSSNNRIYLNNFMENTFSVYSYGSTNIWKSPKEITYTHNDKIYKNFLGNYWSDYKEKYPDAVEIDGTGIWNIPYGIDSDKDNYPLMEPFENYFAPSLQKMVNPVEGYLIGVPFCTKYYEPPIHHEGIDIDSKIAGNEVIAVADGVVIYIHRRITSWAGCWIWIWHGTIQTNEVKNIEDISTRYLHLKDIPPEFEPGTRVYQGKTVLGKVWNSGSGLPDSKGVPRYFDPHLHFEVRQGSVTIGSANYKATSPLPPLQFVDFTTKPKTLAIAGYSPIDLVVTDPQGFIVGKEVNQLPENALYWELPITDDEGIYDLVTIDKRKIGDYLLTLVLEPEASFIDTYTLEVRTDSKTVILAENVQISDIPAHPYTIRVTEMEIILIMPATIDFDPDNLNLKSKGQWITVFIELPVGHGYDINEIDISSIILNGTVPASPKPIEVDDYDNDGIPDLMVKFDKRDVQNLFIELLNPGTYTIEITGKVSDIEFRAFDSVKIL